MCSHLIKASGIGTVIYSDDSGNLVRKRSNDLSGTHITRGMKAVSKSEKASLICSNFIRNEVREYNKSIRKRSKKNN